MKEIIISNHNGEPVASSLEVATNFDKGHNHVVRDIEKIKKGLSKFGHTPEMFFEATYQHPQNKQFYKCYEMTKDGFTLLAMGFSGQKALAWKLNKKPALDKQAVMCYNIRVRKNTVRFAVSVSF